MRYLKIGLEIKQPGERIAGFTQVVSGGKLRNPVVWAKDNPEFQY